MAGKKDKDKAGRPLAGALREMGVDDLRAALAETRTNLMNARFSHAVAQLEKTSELKAMRRQIARISTVLKEKEQRA